MKILPINRQNMKPVFSGYYIEDKGVTHINAGFRTGKRYEKTINVYHSDPKNKIYYADPLEKIDDKLRESVDYIFYDDEPAFPEVEKDISTAYFYKPGPLKSYRLDYFKEAINNYKQYFYRMEMADSKSIDKYLDKLCNNVDVNDSNEKIDYYRARIADAKYNQETAARCIDIMNEATNKINYMDEIGLRIGSLNFQIQDRTKDVEKANIELNNRVELDSILKTKLDNLKERQKNYSNQFNLLNAAKTETEKGIKFTENTLSYNKEHLPHYKSSFSYTEFLALPQAADGYNAAKKELESERKNEDKEIVFIKSQLENVEKRIEKYTAQFNENKIFVKKISDYKIELPKILESLQKELKQKTDEYYKVQAELIPYFDKLKNYFYSRGLKQVKY